jgi:hypothetical protein
MKANLSLNSLKSELLLQMCVFVKLKFYLKNSVHCKHFIMLGINAG